MDDDYARLIEPFIVIVLGCMRVAHGENTLRNFLALSLLITLGASADAATVHRYNAHHHVIVRPGLNSSFAAVPGWAYARPASPIQYDDTPSYNDPSKLGGQPPCGC